MVTTTRDEWLTVKEACEILKISRRTLYRWRDKGIVILYRVGGRQLRLRAGELPVAPAPSGADTTTLHEELVEEYGAMGDSWLAIHADRLDTDRRILGRPALFSSPEESQQRARLAAQRREEAERLLANADTEEGRAALIAARQEWMRKATALRERMRTEHGVGTDSVRTIRIIRQQADRDNRGSSK